MDKQTLSNYGWVVIAVLVLSVMIALATPFGKFVGDAVWNTMESLVEVSDKGMSVAIDKAGNVENGDDVVAGEDGTGSGDVSGDDDVAGEEGSGENNGPQLDGASVTLSSTNPFEITVGAVENATSYTIELGMTGYDRDPVFYTTNQAPFTVDLRDIIANTGDSRLYGMNLTLNICAYADGYTSSAYKLSHVVIEQLETPTLSLDYFTLTIDEVEGATAYEIYIDDELKGTTTDLTVDLWATYGSVSDGTHTVKVIAIDNVNNAYADSVAATIEWSVSEGSGGETELPPSLEVGDGDWGSEF